MLPAVGASAILPDYLPVEMLGELEYCARRFWLMHVQGERCGALPEVDADHSRQWTRENGMERNAEHIE